MIDSTRKVLAVSLVLMLVFVASAIGMGGLDRDHLARDLLVLGLNTLPLLLLRRNPLAAVVIFCTVYPIWLETGHEPSMFESLPMLAALYATGGWAKPLWLRAIALIAPVFMTGAVLYNWWEDAGLLEIGYIAVMFVLAWALGVAVAARRSYERQLEAKTVALESARRELADRAVADERARIARELHDVIAHAMSVITVRAGVGAHLIESRPGEAAQALRVIERTGREALSEMRRMLAVLRDPHPQGPQPDPQPGLSDVPSLVEQVGAAGLAVAVTAEGAVQQLPAGLDLAVYRVIQEALTNVVKHGSGGRAAVAIRYLPSGVEVDVRNPGRYNGPVVPGQGMRGMAERVGLYDGRFHAGPDGDGFTVAASFPIEAQEAGT